MSDGFTTTNKQPRPRVRVIFEFSVLTPKPFIYRAVQATDGGYRMEKRGANAKNFFPVMWTGSEDGLRQFREAVEHWNARYNRA